MTCLSGDNSPIHPKVRPVPFSPLFPPSIIPSATSVILEFRYEDASHRSCKGCDAPPVGVMRFFVSPLCSDRRKAACHYDALLSVSPLGLLAFSAGYSQRVHLMLSL